MAVFTKYNSFIDELSTGGHNLKTDVLKLALTNTAPVAASDTTMGYPPPSNADGYPTGGNAISVTSAATAGGIFRLVAADNLFTAGPAGIGPFRYVVLYNSTKSNKLVGFYDYGSSITLNNTDTFTTDFDNVNGVLTIQ